MRYLFFLILMSSRIFCMAGEGDLLHVRNLYYKASANRDDAEAFNTFLTASPNIHTSLLEGYRGMCYMIRANHSWNPYNKLSFFNKGKDLLDGSIQKAPQNMELRFLRFCVQTNAPGFLGYSGKIAEDKALILSLYGTCEDADLKSRVRNYLMSSTHCTAADKERLK